MGSNYNNKVHFNDSTSLDVDSGGQIVVAPGANMQYPVLGSTDYSSTDVATGTTLYREGTVILEQVRPTTAIYARTFTVQSPIKGCHLDIIVCTTASTECTIDINLGSGVGVQGNANTTSKQWIRSEERV
jgi:hypothetical protein